MSKYRIELTRENQSALAKSAKVNGRSAVKELNIILRDHFQQEALVSSIKEHKAAQLKAS